MENSKKKMGAVLGTPTKGKGMEKKTSKVEIESIKGSKESLKGVDDGVPRRRFSFRSNVRAPELTLYRKVEDTSMDEIDVIVPNSGGSDNAMSSTSFCTVEQKGRKRRIDASASAAGGFKKVTRLALKTETGPAPMTVRNRLSRVLKLGGPTKDLAEVSKLRPKTRLVSIPSSPRQNIERVTGDEVVAVNAVDIVESSFKKVTRSSASLALESESPHSGVSEAMRVDKRKEGDTNAEQEKLEVVAGCSKHESTKSGEEKAPCPKNETEICKTEKISLTNSEKQKGVDNIAASTSGASNSKRMSGDAPNDIYGTVAQKSSGSRSSSPSLSESEYEVEQILDYRNDPEYELYHVKWKGWDSSANTWEPIDNLVGCADILYAFYCARRAQKIAKPNLKVQVPPDPRPLEERVSEFINRFRPLEDGELDEAYATVVKKNHFKNFWWDRLKLDRWLEEAKTKDKLTDARKEELRKQCLYWHSDFEKARKGVELKEWCAKLNSITEGKPEILVENEFDLEGPPERFTYINDYVTHEVIIPDDPPVGCACEDCFTSKNTCCPKGSKVAFAYNENKRIRVEEGSAVYECNKKCLCSSDCINRVVQDGVSALKGMRYCIYRTSNGCGWGVKTLKPIKKGTFVCLYVGEILSTDEAEERGQSYDQEGSTYLFDLDFNNKADEDCPYTIDAALKGNVSHFMNHSCEPNLAVFGVYVNCLDPNLPKLALFATRNIAENEEMCFDYKSKGASQPNIGGRPRNEQPIIRTKLCVCGSRDCRNWLF